MYLERKEDLSVNYFIQRSFSDVGKLEVVDGFPETLLTIPTISVEVGRTQVEEFELGNRDGMRIRNWFVDIYAVNKSQRDEYGYRLLDLLKNGIDVFDYDLGFPPVVVPVIGHLTVLSKSLEPVRIVAGMTEKLYYRATLSFVAYNEIV